MHVRVILCVRAAACLWAVAMAVVGGWAQNLVRVENEGRAANRWSMMIGSRTAAGACSGGRVGGWRMRSRQQNDAASVENEGAGSRTTAAASLSSIGVGYPRRARARRQVRAWRDSLERPRRRCSSADAPSHVPNWCHLRNFTTRIGRCSRTVLDILTWGWGFGCWEPGPTAVSSPTLL